MTDHPADKPGDTAGPRRSSVKFFHAVFFVLGGGLGLLWSWWGALLIGFGVVAAYTVARSLTSPANVGETRARLQRLQADLRDVKHIVDHPDTASPDEVARMRALMKQFHLTPPDDDTPPKPNDGGAERGSS